MGREILVHKHIPDQKESGLLGEMADAKQGWGRLSMR